jgi:protein-tyrosine phosphatase
MILGYRTMIEGGGDLIGRAVSLVMENVGRGAVVFHCTAGKDRTGILAAVLLLVLKVWEEDIIADYQVSYTYNEEEVNRIMERIPEIREHVAGAGEESMLHSPPKNMKTVFELLHAGNITQWLESQGIPAALQEKFRETMLT